MARLIDADKFFQDFKIISFMNIEGHPMVAASVVLMLLDAQPIAYDVERVVEEKRKSFNEIRKAGYGHGYSDGYKKALYELAEDISEKAFENSFKITMTDGNGVTYPVDVVTLDYVSEMVFDLAEQLEDAMTY